MNLTAILKYLYISLPGGSDDGVSVCKSGRPGFNPTDSGRSTMEREM